MIVSYLMRIFIEREFFIFHSVLINATCNIIYLYLYGATVV